MKSIIAKLAMVVSVAFLISACSSSQKDAGSEKQEAAAAEAAKPAAAAPTAESAGAVSCSLAKDMRNLEVKPVDKGCQLHYTKLGKTKVVARSAYGKGHCEKSQDKIKGKLEEAGFKCK